jgi:hypothetical protein
MSFEVIKSLAMLGGLCILLLALTVIFGGFVQIPRQSAP